MQADHAPWWQASNSEIHERIWAHVEFLRQNQSVTQRKHQVHQALYENQRARVPAVTEAFMAGRGTPLNVVKSMADTVHAKITKSSPRPRFLTEQGHWGHFRKAKKLQKFVDGVFHANDVYDVMSHAFLDAEIHGRGFVHVFEKDSGVCFERVPAYEIIVDEEEARFGPPRSMHRRKLIDRYELKAIWGDKSRFRAAIEAAQDEQDEYGTGNRPRTNLVPVIESWHLPSRPGAKDGKHVLSIQGVAFVVEGWEEDCFPIPSIAWGKSLEAYWPIGLAEELRPIQVELSHLASRIARSMHLISVPRIFVEKGSSIVKSHLRNEIGDVVEYVGQPPIINNPSAVPPEMFSHLDRLYQRAFEIAGISQLSAQSSKPAGLNSGAALREFKDSETERFAAKSAAYDRLAIDLAKLAISCMRELAEREADVTVKAKGGEFLETIRWSDVDLEDDQFDMQLWPSNLVPKTPAGQMALAQDLTQLGLLDPEEVLEAIDFPDIGRITRRKLAERREIERVIDVLESGKYETAEPHQALELGVRMVRANMFDAKERGAPATVIDVHMRWIEGALALVQKAQAPAPVPGMPAGAPPPPGGPAAPGPVPGPPLPPGMPPGMPV